MTVISLSSWSESDQKAIREQLVRILNSGPFHQSQRRQRFLAEHPAQAAAYNDRAQTDVNLSDPAELWQFVAPKPTELSDLNDAEVMRLADQAAQYQPEPIV